MLFKLKEGRKKSKNLRAKLQENTYFSMSVALLVGVVSPNSEISNGFGYLENAREGSRIMDYSSRLISGDRSLLFRSSRIKKGKMHKRSRCSVNAVSKYSCLGNSGLENGGSSTTFPVCSSMVVNPVGEMTLSSEQKVYDVVLKQAALVKKQLSSNDVKPDVLLPGTLSLLSEAYDRCGEVCAEYAKTFYLG